MTEPETLRSVLNDILLELTQRIEATERMPGMMVLPQLAFSIGAAYSPTSDPFSLASGGLRVSVPFVPKGVVLLRLENAADPATPLSTASSVSWSLVAASDGGASIQIDFVSGLAINTSYRMTLGVTRG